MKHSLFPYARIGLGSRSIRIVCLFTLLALCASLLPASPTQAANGSFAWVRSMGGISGQRGESIAVDAAGSVYTTGIFGGTADFDPGPGTANLISAGLEDVFVSKLDSSGNFVWAKSLGGVNSDRGTDIAVDASGNVYTAGNFAGTVDFDPGPGTFNLTGSGGVDIFISKLDSSGEFVWARKVGGLSDDSGESLAVDASGNVYFTGFFQGTVDFDPGSSTYDLTSAGGDDIFVSKLDSSGSLLWARRMGGVDEERPDSLAVDTGGNVYTSGSFFGHTDFDPGDALYVLTSEGGTDVFISKLDSSGNFVWATQTAGSAALLPNFGLAVDASGNVYITGSFEGTGDFDAGAGTANLTSIGTFDIFVAKLAASGSFLWARQMGGMEFDNSYSLALDASGNVYTTGGFIGTADFDPGPGTYTLTGAPGNSADIFVSKLDRDGNFIWARAMSGVGAESGIGLALDTGGNVYTTGYFFGTVDFNPGAGTANLTSVGSPDIFVVKLQETAIFADVPLGYWALDFVERLYGAGITGGCATSPLRYCPEETVTRAQMAVFLLRGRYGSSYTPPAVDTSTGFGDVPTSYWAGAFIKQLAAEGITAGCGGGNYCPEQPVTRAQMAVFLLRAKYGASYTPPAVGSGTGFGDVSPSYWAAAFIKQLVAEGITVGCGSGNYCSETPVTRAQMAVFLVRTFSLP